MIILTGLDAEKRRESARRIAYDLLCVDRPHPDIIWVKHEKPKTISVEEIRHQVCDDVYIRPFKAPCKVYIIDDAGLMTQQAQNALLKTLEEPPEYVFIILITDNEESLLETIRSRCNIRRTEGSEEISEEKDEIKYLRTLYHDVLVYKSLKDESLLILKNELENIKEIAGSKDFSDIGKILEAIDKADARIGANVNPEISLAIMKGKL